MTSDRTRQPVFGSTGVLKRAGRLAAASLMCGALALSLFTSAGCVGDEDFKCCECTFPSCVDMNMMPVPQDLCVCTQTFTYEDCGLYCRDTAPVDLWNQGLRGCGTATNSMAKNSCSVGSPVGE
jgi:hypothetical protein